MLERFFHRIADDSRPRNPVESTAQSLLGVAGSFYGVGAGLHRLLHAVGILRRGELPAPVLSVGNLTLGGTGKTPFTLWLAEELQRLGRRPAILTRGYGREEEGRLTVVHDGRRLRAGTRRAGDEPVLLARALRTVPVLACADRTKAGALAHGRLRTDCFILDDGFQTHRVARQGDIVLVDATRPLSGLRLFPRGTLREPVTGLRRAHLIVLTRWDQATRRAEVLRQVQAVAPGVPVVRTRLRIEDAFRVADRRAVPLEQLQGADAVVLCGVAHPASVQRTVEGLGMRVRHLRALPDHARPTRTLLTQADSLRRRLGAQWLVVTEKDAVKIMETGAVPPEVLCVRGRVEFCSAKDAATARRVVAARLESAGVRGLLQ